MHRLPNAEELRVFTVVARKSSFVTAAEELSALSANDGEMAVLWAVDGHGVVLRSL